jgi:hypothetical protein
MMVLVACYLHRLVGPLGASLKELVQQAKLQNLLRYTVEANVQICIIDTLTGPTADVVHIIRHRRVTQDADQHKGNQSDPHRLYVGLTRGKISTTVWMEKEPFGMPASRAARVSPATHANDAAAQTFFDKMFDAIQELNIPVQDVDTGFDLPFFFCNSTKLYLTRQPKLGSTLLHQRSLWREDGTI